MRSHVASHVGCGMMVVASSVRRFSAVATSGFSAVATSGPSSAVAEATRASIAQDALKQADRIRQNAALMGQKDWILKNV